MMELYFAVSAESTSSSFTSCNYSKQLDTQEKFKRRLLSTQLRRQTICFKNSALKKKTKLCFLLICQQPLTLHMVQKSKRQKILSDKNLEVFFEIKVFLVQWFLNSCRNLASKDPHLITYDSKY